MKPFISEDMATLIARAGFHLEKETPHAIFYARPGYRLSVLDPVRGSTAYVIDQANAFGKPVRGGESWRGKLSGLSRRLKHLGLI